MKKILLLISQIIISTYCFSQNPYKYTSLDSANPILFNGKSIHFQDKDIILGPNAFFIDGRLNNEEIQKLPFVFNSIQEAAKQLTDGTEDDPMVLYIAPWVYWIDNPDDPEIRSRKNGPVPYGIEIECEYLHFYGLSKNAKNVVLACNRGQTMGAIGNFTLFRFSGDGTSSENITFGNYCNVDLKFPLNPKLNRQKRGSAIVQAQLIHCNGDKIVARNTHFISRLNLCNFIGAQRILFDNCHFECTDDALCGTGVYLNCTFDFYSSKPFYNTLGTGAVFLNCDINSVTRGNQYFTKANGQVAVIDTRFNAKLVNYIGWRDVPPIEMRNYQYNVLLNKQPNLISSKNVTSTIDMNHLPVLDAYRIQLGDKVIYNTYNLLRGDDDWDPAGIKKEVFKAQIQNQKRYIGLPTQIRILSTNNFIETGKDTLQLETQVSRFGEYKEEAAIVKWSVSPKDSSIVQIIPTENTLACTIIPTNNNDETRKVIIHASNELGIEAASVVDVSPAKLETPEFSKSPKISKPNEGKLTLNYTLDMNYADESLVTWYRCKNKNGSHPIEIAVSRYNKPFKTYELSPSDIGYYLMATIAPKHLRCEAGAPTQAITTKPIMSENVISDTNILTTIFKNTSVNNQCQIIPGFWTFRPLETKKDGIIIPVDTTEQAWFYGKGSDGNANMMGLLQTGRSATMLYTPVKEKDNNMNLKMTVAPFKTAGQGFSVAPLYMDVLIQFNNRTLSGYALRFIRTTKYSNAVDCYFVKYENGLAKQLSKEVSTSCFRTPCLIELSLIENKLSAHVATTNKYPAYTKYPEVLPEVSIETEVESNIFGGFGVLYNGGSTTMINELSVNWIKRNGEL